MRKIITAVGISFAACACATPASAAEDDAWYVAVAGTVSILDDSETEVVGLPAPIGTVKTVNAMGTGYGFTVAVGREIGMARLEIEGGYASNDSDHYVAIAPPTGTIAAEGGHKSWRVMGNAYLDFGSGDLRPYLGAGVGYADIKARLFSARPPFPNEAPLLILDDNKGEFVYQLMAGGAYNVSPKIAVTAQYRWMSAGKVHFRDLSNFEVIREHEGHNIDLGVRVRF
ncbi:outer membrane protein [Qipengyuania soli]|uniref:Porin family protein n=1 Tax=Qipengyuania soli TaxID=2782568 RepID=A0A7S8F683_9SPHN|nr:outer membrane beta-barrel protein [Qipengyuania soli]QPC99748.1 porin family protein [Qipengyuania soli]